MEILKRFVRIAPELATRGEEELQDYIDIATEKVLYRSLTDVQRDTLIVYLAAHIATIALKRYGASGAATTVSEGKLSISYSRALSVARDTYDLTDYGQQYKKLCAEYIVCRQGNLWWL